MITNTGYPADIPYEISFLYELTKELVYLRGLQNPSRIAIDRKDGKFWARCGDYSVGPYDAEDVAIHHGNLMLPVPVPAELAEYLHEMLQKGMDHIAVTIERNKGG